MERNEDALLPLNEAARFLGLSRSSLLRLEAEGEIAPYRTAGGHRRYERSALAALRSELTLRRAAGDVVRAPAVSAHPDATLPGYAAVARLGALLLTEADPQQLYLCGAEAARELCSSSAAYFPLDSCGQIGAGISPGDAAERLQPYAAVLFSERAPQGDAEYISDVRAGARFAALANVPGGLRSFLAAPVPADPVPGGAVRGFLLVAHENAAAFGEREKDLLAAVAVHLAVAVVHAEQRDQATQRHALIALLHRVAKTLVLENDPHAALRCVLYACRALTGAACAALEYRNFYEQPVRLVSDPRGDTLREVEPTILAPYLLEGWDELVVPDVRRQPGAAALAADAPRSFLAVALRNEDGEYQGGVFLGHDAPDHFRAGQAAAVRTLTVESIRSLEEMLAADPNAEARRELESIFNGIADPLTVLDHTLTIVECNDGLLHRLGKQREEVVGRPYVEALVGNVADGVWNVAPRVFETGEPQTARVPMVNGEGAAILMDVTAYPVRDTRGKVVKVVEYAKEVTAEVRLQLALMDRNQELNAATESLARQTNELDRLNRELREKMEELERIAVTDVMTGLPNHRAFQESMLREMKCALRDQAALSLLLIDVDHFKAYNDAYGHPAGDEVLKGVGALLAASLRDGDTPARYGGEEFAVVLPNTDREQAAEIAERIRVAISAHRFPKRSISVSVGLASFPGDARDKDTLISLADQALYAAKQAGRNTIRTWPLLETLDLAA